jgi:hypothetical protein
MATGPGTGPERTAVHDRVRDAVYGIMREGGLRTTWEQLGLMPIVEGETTGRVIDLVGVETPGAGEDIGRTRRWQTVVGQGIYGARQCRPRADGSGSQRGEGWQAQEVPRSSTG